MLYKSKKINLKNKKILIVGASSGMGRSLAIRLINVGGQVWGIARRENLLKNLKEEVEKPENFRYTASDIRRKNSWKNIIATLKKNNFSPDVVVLSAAILRNDLNNQIDIKTDREMFEINYFSILEGINSLLPLLKHNSQIITISSISSQKGSGAEGIGYAASKAALSIAFESLHQKFNKKIKFKTVFFGPVNTGMNPFAKHSILTLSEEQAVDTLIEAIEGRNVFYYRPQLVFFILKSVKLISQKLYFKLLDYIDVMHVRNQKE